MKKLISMLVCACVLAASLSACKNGESKTAAETTAATTTTASSASENTAESETDAEKTAEETEEETEAAYLSVQGDAPFEYIECASLPQDVLDYVPVYSNSIVVAATINIYNTETGEFVRTVDLFAREGEDGFGDLSLGENEAYLTYGFTCLSTDSEDTVEAGYAMVFEPGDTMQFQKAAEIGQGFHYATVETDGLGNFIIGDTEDAIAEKQSYLTENGFQTKIVLQTEIVPQFE